MFRKNHHLSEGPTAQGQRTVAFDWGFTAVSLTAQQRLVIWRVMISLKLIKISFSEYNIFLNHKNTQQFLKTMATDWLQDLLWVPRCGGWVYLLREWTKVKIQVLRSAFPHATKYPEIKFSLTLAITTFSFPKTINYDHLFFSDIPVLQ